MPDFTTVADAITSARGQTFVPAQTRSIAGGSIHSAWIIANGTDRFFIKLNAPASLPMFEAEAAGLAALNATGAVRVPAVICCGCVADQAYLVLECLDLSALDRSSGAHLGTALAALHRSSGAAYGWHADNFIGAAPQENAWNSQWSRFYADHRLRPQLRLALANGMNKKLVEQGETLAGKMAAFFLDAQPRPSLLHGDLWSGNAARLADGTPAIYDPACYFGDREADIAMAELFGGFPESFYAAYREAWPLSASFETRKSLYNLYHVLNHFNLFGAAYLGQAERMIGRLLAELRG